MAKSTSKTNTITLEGAFSSIQGLDFDGKLVVSADSLEIRARNYIPVPNTTSPIL